MLKQTQKAINKGLNRDHDTSYRRDFLKARPTFMGYRFCAYCLKPMSKNYKQMEVDHVYPHSRLGSNKPHNLVASCKKCNRKKSDSTALHYLVRGYIASGVSTYYSLLKENTLQAIAGAIIAVVFVWMFLLPTIAKVL